MGIDWEFYTGLSGEDLAYAMDGGDDYDYSRDYYEESERRDEQRTYFSSLPSDKTERGGFDKELKPGKDGYIELWEEVYAELAEKTVEPGQPEEKSLNGRSDGPFPDDADDYPY